MAFIGLISCVSKKRIYKTEAKSLYNSDLFIKSRFYIEKNCNDWYILSAKYGLVSPDEIIEPYEETLNTKTKQEREQWTNKVWNRLSLKLKKGDTVIIIAGKRYREFLVQKIEELECRVIVPLKGMSIGNQLKWLSEHSKNLNRNKDIDKCYKLLSTLEYNLGGKRLMSECNGRQNWSKRGLYFFFEPGETRLYNKEMRVVRVGTHAISRGSKSTLWNRLHTHKGTSYGFGNHRGSVFRLHIGSALSIRDKSLKVQSWGIGQSANTDVRLKEKLLEQAVSYYIGKMSILWLAIEDEPGPSSDRAYLERNLIGLLSGGKGSVDLPSSEWLGHFSPHERIRESGLWNLDFLDYSYSTEFLDILEEYVLVTIGKKPKLNRSIAPINWNHFKQQHIKNNQLLLFEEEKCE